MSGGGPLTSDISLQLRGDESDPGSLSYYGTDSEGKKGWHKLPENILSLISLEARVKALEIAMTALTVRVTAAENTIADHESRIISLEDLSVQDGVVWYVTAIDYVVTAGINHVKATTAGITITLPDALTIRKIVVKNATAGIVGVTSVSLIDGLASAFLAGQESIQCVADGTTWNIT